MHDILSNLTATNETVNIMFLFIDTQNCIRLRGCSRMFIGRITRDVLMLDID